MAQIPRNFKESLGNCLGMPGNFIGIPQQSLKNPHAQTMEFVSILSGCVREPLAQCRKGSIKQTKWSFNTVLALRWGILN